MDAPNFLINILISILITLAVVLIPYIVIRLITHRKIQDKTAKVITLVYSIISFLIFLIIGILTDGEAVSIFPVILWNAVGYMIIRPKNKEPQEIPKSSPEKIQMAEMLSEQNIKRSNMDLIPNKISSMLKANCSLFAENPYTLSDTLLFSYYIVSYYVSNSSMLDMRKKEFLRHIKNKLLNIASDDFNYEKNEVIDLWRKRNNYVKNIFLQNDGVLNLSKIISEFILIYNYDISENKYIEINENTPLILQGFDDSIEYNILAKSFFDTIVGAVVQTVSTPNAEKQTISKQNNKASELLQESSIAELNFMNDKFPLMKKKEHKYSIKNKPKTNQIIIILSVTTAIFLVSTIALSIGLISVNSDYKKLSAKIYDMEATIEEKDDEISRLDRQALNQRGTISSLQRKLDFYDSYAVCVNDGDPYYHKPNCVYFDSSSFYIYNTATAETYGYTECPYCF